MDQQKIAFLRASLKQAKHMMTHLKDESSFNDYFHDEKELKEAVDIFFDLDDSEVIALYSLGYPFRGEIFFDESIIPRIIQLIPEFLLSILKQGNSFLFTVFKFQITRPHKDVKIESSNLRRISENIFYVWQKIAELEIMEADKKKRDALSQLSSLVQFDKLYYDVLACFQMNLMSQFQYLDAMKVKIQSGDSPKIYPDTDKRRLLTQIVGYLALPIEMAEHIEISDDITDYQSLLLQQLKEAGFIQNIHTAFEQQSPKPTLANSIKQVQALNEGEYVFQRIGDVWNIKYGAEYYQFNNMKGFEYVHEILSHFPNPVSPEVLSGSSNISLIQEGVIIPDDEMKSIKQKEDPEAIRYASRDYSLTADKKQYKLMQSQKRVLESELKEIDPDDPKQSKLVNEINQLSKSISRYYNLHGEPRPQYEGSEKARGSVTKAIARAKKEIAISMPNLYTHLKKYLKGGYEFRYMIKETEAPPWLL